jgi:hypothetical protein
MARGVLGTENAIDGRLFQVFDSHLLFGRSFSEEETAGGLPVAIVNVQGARALWPNQHPSIVLGRRVDAYGASRTIVGIVEDISIQPGEPAPPALFVPLNTRQFRSAATPVFVLTRTRPGVAPDGRSLTAALNRRFPPNALQIRSVDAGLEPLRQRPRFLGVLFMSLSIVVLVISAIGLYSVANLEAQRLTPSLAIRHALGAPTAAICWYLTRRMLLPVTVGVVTACGVFAPYLDRVRTIAENSTSVAAAATAAVLIVVATAAIAMAGPVRAAGQRVITLQLSAR